MRPSSAKNAADMMHCHKFIIEMARCSLAFGAPSHRLEAQLSTAAKVLDIEAEFLLLPNVVFISFFDAEQGAHSSGLHVIKRIGGISLSQLRASHSVYRKVISLECTPEQGWKTLVITQQSKLPYREIVRCFIAFLCGAVITVLAFNGSFLDSIAAGIAQGALVFLNFKLIGSEPIVARIFEYILLIQSFLCHIHQTHTTLSKTLCSIHYFLYCPWPIFTHGSQDMLFSCLIRRHSSNPARFCC
jgi:uncharacterized membrane protein YjjP (DUF1212 family)